jgi:hypothetical protein
MYRYICTVTAEMGESGKHGYCVACFDRDIAGALGLHRAAVVQYIRPEILGFVLGSLIAAYLFKEFRPRVGSAPIVRFVLGIFAMIGALVFLGCPWRALLRLSGGDWNAVLGLLGLITGMRIAETNSLIPWFFEATIGTTGTPRYFSSRPTSMRIPCRSATSIIFRATMTGTFKRSNSARGDKDFFLLPMHWL